MSSARNFTYCVGATQITIGLSATVEIKPEAGQSKWLYKKASGGSLAVVQGPSSVCSQGYLLGNNEAITYEGPATFYLAAAGATVVVHAMISYTEGRD